MKQSDAVLRAIQAIKGQDEFTEPVTLTTDERRRVIDQVTEGILSGEVAFSDRARKRYDTDAKVRSYVVGMVSNHLRKDRRLNGGVSYQPKNPGSRTGSQDPVVRELRKLMRVAPEEHKQTIRDEINQRLEELRRAKLQEVEIDDSLIPESLRGII